MVQATSFALAAAALCMLAPSADAAPSKRGNLANCKTYATGGLRGVFPGSSYGSINAGILGNVKKNGIDGQSASILVTKDDDGSPIGEQQWEFAVCSDITEHNGRKVGQYSNFYYSYGIVRPKGATKHCLAYSTTDGTAKQRSVVDSVCANIPEADRTWTLMEDLSGRDPLRYSLSLDETTVGVSNTKHAELQFYNNKSDASGVRTVQLAL